MKLVNEDDARKLWLCVIIQLIEDYARPYPIADGDGESKAAKAQAISWFKTNSKDYRLVCDYANVDANKLRRIVLNSNSKDLHGIINKFRETSQPS